MSKLLSLIRRAPKTALFAAGVIVAAVVVPATLFAWGPDNRETFTMDEPAGYVTFNSITDNPDIGDETNFVRIREADKSSMFGDDVTLKAGTTYEVEVFYHNNAASNLNESGQGIAKDVIAKVQMAGVVKAGDKSTITGFINSSNAEPTSVWDNAYMTAPSSGGDFAIRYVPNSAIIASSNGGVYGAKLSDNIFSSGVKLGYDSLNGIVPGCNQYAGYITFRFYADQPNFTVDKQVSVDGGKTWVESATAKAGDTILYRVVYHNTGTVQQDDVVLQDQFPGGVTYVPGTSLIANSKTSGSYKATIDGIEQTGGYNLGSYAPDGNAYFKYSATVAAESALQCGVNTLTNRAIISTANGGKSDTAVVTVNRTCTTPTPTPTPTPVPSGGNTTSLPTTGATEDILSFLGLGTMVTTAGYYIASRRNGLIR